MGRDVVITGIGPVTSIGTGAEELWRGVLEGRSGIRAIESPWAGSFKTRIGAPVEEPDPALSGITEREARLLDPATRIALAGAALALEDAGLETELVDDRRGKERVVGLDPDRAGIVLGTGIGGLCTVEASHRRWVLGEPFTGSARYSLPMLIPNAIPAQIAIRYGLKGECKAVATACAAATMAIGDAFRLIRDNELDVCIAGGSERIVDDVDGYGMLGFELLRTLSTRNDEPERASRPFDRDRDGFVMGEGAGILVLESADHAKARGARIYARVMGYASTCDAHSMMQLSPEPDQIVRVMRRALESAGLEPGDIGYVNAHGTSTRLNDPTEAKALHMVFGKRVWDVFVNSTKSMTGHCIGAAGGIETSVAALSLCRGMLHRCVNLDEPDPECDLALPRENTPIRGRAALSNSFGFGGHNATLALGPA